MISDSQYQDAMPGQHIQSAGTFNMFAKQSPSVCCKCYNGAKLTCSESNSIPPKESITKNITNSPKKKLGFICYILNYFLICDAHGIIPESPLNLLNGFRLVTNEPLAKYDAIPPFQFFCLSANMKMQQLVTTHLHSNTESQPLMGTIMHILAPYKVLKKVDTGNSFQMWTRKKCPRKVEGT